MPINSPRQVLFASLIGTTIEFFDFYIYATAAVLIFPKLFFPASDPASATLASLATFGIAFVARPIGSALFGHFGDRVGRKVTLVAALMTMGVSTVTIGVLPTYDSIGIAAPLLLALCRFGQGLGLGGEWGGAVLLAVENAPPEKRAWYGMFPQLGAPIFQLVANPTWTVPDSIVEEEIAEKSSSWLSANDFTRKDGHWVQGPGPKNSLGIVKFDMKDDEAIYLHDTPAKALFGEPERHESHGCVRVQNAVDFARELAEGRARALPRSPGRPRRPHPPRSRSRATAPSSPI